MKSGLSFAACAAVVLLGAMQSVFAADAAAPAGEAAAARAGASGGQKSAKPALQKGMEAAEVIQLIGKPGEVKVLPSPDGKAERWIYRRLISRTVQQSATGVQNVPAFDGSYGPNMGSRPDMIYSTVYIETYQVTHLLMFNDQLVMAKQWQEKTRSFN